MRLRNLLIAAILACTALHASAQDGEWTYHGGDFSNSRYVGLDQINEDNFEDLSIAWRWKSIETLVTEKNKRVVPSQFKPTPLMVDGIMYLPTSICQVVALNPGTGEILWSFDPESYTSVRPANLGFQHRGLSYWTDGKEARIFIATHDRKLWALDSKTGKPVEEFGEAGVVDLEKTLGRNINPRMITHSSPPGICNDTVIVGSVIFDGPTMKEMPPGHVRGFDARTGKMKWIFHTIPQDGGFGSETWENESWKYSGNTNVWSMFSSDEELNRVYLPVSTATNDMYGGHRLGDNLFAESIVCLDADTGERIWHFQGVHHGVWDYDFPTAPNLVDIEVDGKKIKALAQVSKQANTYVLDRETGEPVWPIEEREVPQSSVPGERTSPTQPFPTKPLAFDRQGFTDDDVIDFTPELKEEALKKLEGWARGPLFTPPTEKGTLGLPSAGGGSNWHGAALDPETNILYVPSNTTLASFSVIKPDPSRSNLNYSTGWTNQGPPRMVKGLPIVKPPYSRVTAINLNTGEHEWMTPHGDGPMDNPALAGIETGPLGAQGSGNGPLLTKSLLFVTQGAAYFGSERDKKHKITVFDKKTGEILGRIPLPAEPYGNPMTYMHKGKQYIVVAVGGGAFFGGPGRNPAELIALSLP
jgi:quinoprotein glucose dehydrogenase